MKNFFLKHSLPILSVVIIGYWHFFSTVNHEHLTVGKKAPLEGAVTSFDGKQWPLKMLAGSKYLLINFWASWCSPCVEELPELRKIALELKDKVQVVGITVDSPAEEVRQVVAEFKLNYPVAQITSETSAAFDVHSLPVSYLVDPQGNILWLREGGIAFEEIKAIIK